MTFLNNRNTCKEQWKIIPVHLNLEIFFWQWHFTVKYG